MNNTFPSAILLTSLLSCGLALAQDSPDSVMRGTKEFRKSVVVSGLAGPWELTWGPDAKLWVTERTGKRVVRVDPATGAAPFIDVIGCYLETEQQKEEPWCQDQ